jgi:hypothetical protein
MCIFIRRKIKDWLGIFCDEGSPSYGGAFSITTAVWWLGFRLMATHFFVNLWDDTYPYEVWNQSDEVRIALLLDMRRLDMPLDLKLLSNFIVKLIGTTIRLRRIF